MNTTRRFLRLILCLLAVTSLAALAETGSSLRYDGLYQADASFKKGNAEEKLSNYLRFYEDGTVIDLSSTGTPAQVNGWFVKGHAGVAEGTYKLDGQALTFTTTIGTGRAAVVVEYSGKIEGDTLVLDSLSHSNQNRSSHTYHFVKP
ncbi:MAG: hypothetical protein M3Y86_08820 [Verrucomicrobiota bacterium]|nr:hypothetical protein [Verrucomicrobiota bacterium]